MSRGVLGVVRLGIACDSSVKKLNTAFPVPPRLSPYNREDADSSDSKLGKLLFRMDPKEVESFNRYREEYNGYRRGHAHGAKGEVKSAQQVYGGKQENKRKRDEDYIMRLGGWY